MTHGATALPYVGRFAPSPTGPLHAGSLLAAVASWLDAAHRSGEWLLRIEDLDSARSREQWRRSFRSDLARFGLRPSREPVLQSRRIALYEDAIERLGAKRLLFRCACTRRELAAEGEPCCLRDCRHRELDPRESALRVDLGTLPTITVQDRSLGPIVFNPKIHRDVVIRRRDGIISYQLAVVVDDALQGVTDVVRGADLNAATQIHVVLQQLLNIPTPRYHHHSLIRDETGKRLAKRSDSEALSSLRKAGHSAQDITERLFSAP